MRMQRIRHRLLAPMFALTLVLAVTPTSRANIVTNVDTQYSSANVTAEGSTTGPSPTYAEYDAPNNFSSPAISTFSTGTAPQQSSVRVDPYGDSVNTTSGPLSYNFSSSGITVNASTLTSATRGTGYEAEAEGFASATLYFGVDTTQSFTLADTLVGANSATFVQLTDFTKGTSLVDDTATVTKSTNVTLTAGDIYELQVQENSDSRAFASTAGGNTTTTASFLVNLTPTPEPVSLTFLGLASAGLLARRRRQQYASHHMNP